MLYLGGVHQRESREKVPGCKYLEFARVSTTHALAYSNAVYDKILQDVPDNPTEVALWLRSGVEAIDWYYFEKFGGSALIVTPVIASQMNLLQYETRSFE